MPQLFQVLRCYKCLSFQVHQTKKSNKWECKLCGEKQSVKRHYGVGIAKDCRLHVQKLNSMRGEHNELKYSQMLRNCESDEDEKKDEQVSTSIKITTQPLPNSKWSNFFEAPEAVEENGEPATLGDAEVVLEVPKKRRKLFRRNSKFNPPPVSHSVVKDNCTKDKALNLTPIHSNLEQVKNKPTGSLQEQIIEKENKIPNLNKNKQPVISKQSKWVDYVEDEIDEIEDTELNSSNNVNASNGPIFSLCDDSELDSVLNI